MSDNKEWGTESRTEEYNEQSGQLVAVSDRKWQILNGRGHSEK